LAVAGLLLLTLACAAPTAPPAEDTPENRMERSQVLARMEVDGGALDATLDLGASLAHDFTNDMLTIDLGRELSTEEQQKVLGIMRATLADVLTRERFEEAVAEVYAKHFTPAELDEAIAFFASPTGAKTLSLQGVITDQVGDAAEAIVEEHLEAFSSAVDQALAAEFEGYVVEEQAP